MTGVQTCALPISPKNPKEEKITNLKKQLELAVELENYEEAAKLREIGRASCRERV